MVIFFLLLPSLATAQWQACGDAGNYTANSAYQANIGILSSTLPTRIASNATLFATEIVGDGPDTVYALALCRPDTTTSACGNCVSTGFQDAPQLCLYNKEATVYYDPCMLHFSNTNFLANTTNNTITTDSSTVILSNSQNFTTNVSLSLFTLLNSTAQSAANNARRFMESSLTVRSSTNLTLHCLMQCTPDLTADECAACFQGIIQLTREYLDGPRGGRILGVRCNMRFEIYTFYQGNGAPKSPQAQPPAAAAPPPEARTTVQEQQGHNSRKSKKLWIIAIAAPLLSILLCFMFSFAWMRRRRKGKANLQDQAVLNSRKEEESLVWRLEEKSSEFTIFEFSEVLDATDNFSEQNRLGQGGFSPVYKGQLPGGLEIAVKRLASHSGQGFIEFKNEVELIAKLQHNIVRLLGCCIQGEEKILVYEYLPNKSLDFFIFDGKKKTLLDWNVRRAIIEGIAQGLLYLHKHSRLRVIHRDLKASNILLDQDMNPKISDFGLARIFGSSDTQGSTRRVVGTYGYMSPEYASEGIYSIKSDVFSFGVLLLEILSGKRNSGSQQYGDFLNLLGHSWQLWEGGRWVELLDVTITLEPDGR